MLTTQQVNNITDDAVNLRDALVRRRVSTNTANDWVGQAMMAIVMAEVDTSLQTDHASPGWAVDKSLPPNYGWRAGKSDVTGDIPGWPSSEQQAAKQEQLRAEQARMGNVTGKLSDLHPDMLQLLALGPERGQEMRLVTVQDGLIPGYAKTWVRENVPEAGQVTNTRYAGRAESGSPVYLVTYELKDPGTQPAAASGLIDRDEPPGYTTIGDNLYGPRS